jgi:hypothetical protein
MAQKGPFALLWRAEEVKRLPWGWYSICEESRRKLLLTKHDRDYDIRLAFPHMGKMVARLEKMNRGTSVDKALRHDFMIQPDSFIDVLGKSLGPQLVWSLRCGKPWYIYASTKGRIIFASPDREFLLAHKGGYSCQQT